MSAAHDRFARDARGVSSIEYVVVLALAALVTLSAWAALGDVVVRDVDCAAHAISGGGGTRCGPGAAPARSGGSRTPAVDNARGGRASRGGRSIGASGAAAYAGAAASAIGRAAPGGRARGALSIGETIEWAIDAATSWLGSGEDDWLGGVLGEARVKQALERASAARAAERAKREELARERREREEEERRRHEWERASGARLRTQLATTVPGEWSEPFPGVSQVHRQTEDQNVNATVIDLCGAGVSVGATGPDGPRRTVEQVGNETGAQIVVNGDYFDTGSATPSVDGIAIAGGRSWGGIDHAYTGPIAFGDGRAEIVPHWDTAGPAPWMQFAVSGHPTIVLDGAPVTDSIDPATDDPLCTNREPRTAAGLSRDGRALILVVVDGRGPGRAGMTCSELAALMIELGAHSAVNFDGGGSSSMWLGGQGIVNHPSDGGPRAVGNHLVVSATGNGSAPACAP